MSGLNVEKPQVNLLQSLNKSVSLDSVEVIRLDEDTNYTYAKSCKGGIIIHFYSYNSPF